MWKPIETAPKGREVLVCGGEYLFSDETYPEFRPCKHTAMASYNEMHGEWRGAQLSHDEYVIHKPTHWQEIPQPFGQHASDCAVNNEPALPKGPCSCGAE